MLAASIVFLADLFVAWSDIWTTSRLLEAGILFDFSIVIPLLYLWFYRSRGRAAIIHAVALSCLGIWLAGHVVPDEYHQIISKIGFFRYVGIALITVIEVKLMVMIYRNALRGSNEWKKTLAAAENIGMPAWVARLIIRVVTWEAALWRKVWKGLLGLFDRK